MLTSHILLLYIHSERCQCCQLQNSFNFGLTGLKNWDPSILGRVFGVKDIYPRNVLSEVIVGNTEFC